MGNAARNDRKSSTSVFHILKNYEYSCFNRLFYYTSPFIGAEQVLLIEGVAYIETEKFIELKLNSKNTLKLS